jgi:hypothetical protein
MSTTTDSKINFKERIRAKNKSISQDKYIPFSATTSGFQVSNEIYGV